MLDVEWDEQEVLRRLDKVDELVLFTGLFIIVRASIHPVHSLVLSNVIHLAFRDFMPVCSLARLLQKCRFYLLY